MTDGRGEQDVVEYARQIHEGAPEAAARLLSRPNAVVCRAAVEEGLPRRFVVVGVSARTTLLDAVADPRAAGGETSYPEVFARLEQVLDAAEVEWSVERKSTVASGVDIIEWDQESGQRAALRLLGPSTPNSITTRAHRSQWLQMAWRSAGDPYAKWFAEPGVPKVEQPRGLWKVLEPRFTRFLMQRIPWNPQKYRPQRRPLPGATGDPVTDARLIIEVLHQVADQTAPVSPHALFA